MLKSAFPVPGDCDDAAGIEIETVEADAADVAGRAVVGRTGVVVVADAICEGIVEKH